MKLIDLGKNRSVSNCDSNRGGYQNKVNLGEKSFFMAQTADSLALSIIVSRVLFFYFSFSKTCQEIERKKEKEFTAKTFRSMSIPQRQSCRRCVGFFTQNEKAFQSKIDNHSRISFIF
jgi:hypothetical protein